MSWMWHHRTTWAQTNSATLLEGYTPILSSAAFWCAYFANWKIRTRRKNQHAYHYSGHSKSSSVCSYNSIRRRGNKNRRRSPAVAITHENGSQATDIKKYTQHDNPNNTDWVGDREKERTSGKRMMISACVKPSSHQCKNIAIPYAVGCRRAILSLSFSISLLDVCVHCSRTFTSQQCCERRQKAKFYRFCLTSSNKMN